MKQNCWEFHRCGREISGSKIKELGTCPASKETRVNEINGGLNGGRVCWAIAGTLCDDKVSGSIALKIKDCYECDFYKKVKKEEGEHFVGTNVFYHY